MSQILPVREQLKALESIQELDLKIDSLRKQKSALPVALKAADDAHSKTLQAVTLKQGTLNEIEKSERQNQAALELNKDRLARAHTKLEAVQSGPEYNAANKEIDQLKKLNAQLEEQMAKMKADRENGQNEIKNLDGKVAAAKAVFDAQSAEVDGKVGELDKQMSTLFDARSKLMPQVEARVLTMYDRVRAGRAGMGLAPAIGGRCGGCNMMVPPQLFIEVCKLTTFHQCSSCHRILYAPGQPGSAPEKGA